MPLEGLWWVPDMADFDPTDKSTWCWTAMICLPDAVTETIASEVIPAVTATKELAAGTKARMEYYAEGTAGQVLHIGPYADEAPTIVGLHDFITGHSYELTGEHHEIYLSDARRADPTKLRTIIRQPCTGA